MKNPLHIAVLVSGSGTNLQALIDAQKAGSLPVVIKRVFSNRRQAFALERASKAGIATFTIPSKNFSSREEHEKEISKVLDQEGVELVVLAGYRRLLSPYFVRHYQNRIINIHPALLPSFPGINSIARAYQAGVKVSGITVHFVDEGEDTGPIILQQAVRLEEGMSLEQFAEKMHQQEHLLICQAVKLFALGKLKIAENRVIISP